MQMLAPACPATMIKQLAALGNWPRLKQAATSSVQMAGGHGGKKPHLDSETCRVEYGLAGFLCHQEAWTRLRALKHPNYPRAISKMAHTFLALPGVQKQNCG